jgi:hypothetical protein
VAAKPWVVSNELWERIEPLLPKVERRFRSRSEASAGSRQGLHGILFVLHVGSRGVICHSSLASAAARLATAASMSGNAPVFVSGCTRSCLPSCALGDPARLDSHRRQPQRRHAG